MHYYTFLKTIESQFSWMSDVSETESAVDLHDMVDIEWSEVVTQSYSHSETYKLAASIRCVNIAACGEDFTKNEVDIKYTDFKRVQFNSTCTKSTNFNLYMRH